MTRVHVFVSGLVQGVFFRRFVVRSAEKTSVSGWVRNLHGGRVEIVAEGDESHLRSFLELVRKGPVAAQVDDVDINWQEATGEFSGFEKR